MLHNGTKKLFDYWDTLRGERPAPARVDVSPAAIADVLPSTFILEQENSNNFAFRLAGTAICLLFNQELKGKSFADLLDIGDRHILTRLLTTLNSENVCALLELDATADGDRQVSLEVVLLPLSDEQPRILGSIHTLELPYWVGAEVLTSVTIKKMRVLDVNRELFSLHNRPAISMPRQTSRSGNIAKTPRFSVLQGGSMLASPQAGRYNKSYQTPKFVVLDGGRE